MDKLEKIKEDVIKCQKCSLCQTRNLPVIGQGNHQAKILFCGEAPGASEDKTGRPFCGAAGNILDELLASAGIKRDDVYICNILKCRPPGNRNPKSEEIKACTPYLEKQIEIINPKVICALGNYSASFIMEKYGLADKVQGISKIHGQIMKTERNFVIIPLYHPAVATYNRKMIEELKKDFQLLKKYQLSNL
ncbi:MAG: uracil-DNA glycosylase [bacterium]